MTTTDLNDHRIAGITSRDSAAESSDIPQSPGLDKLADRLEVASVKAYGPAATEFWDDLKAGRIGELFDDFVKMFNHAAGIDATPNAANPQLNRGAEQKSAPAAPLTAQDTPSPLATTAPEQQTVVAVQQDKVLAEQPAPATSEDVSRLTPSDDETGSPAAAMILDQNRRDTDAPDPTFSESDHARAASFGAVTSLPGEGNFRMERGADMYGLWSIGSGVGGGIDVDAPDGDPNPKAKKDNDDDGIDDDLEDLRSALDDINEHQRIEQERQETMTQDALDAMAWQGDADETWDVGGITASRRTIYNAAKSVRKNIGKLATDNNWTEDERADQEYWLSEIERNTKLGNKDAVADDETHLKPETKQALDERERKTSLIHDTDAAVSQPTLAVATNAKTNARTSVIAGSDVWDQTSEEGVAVSPTTISAAPGPALSNPPTVEMKADFTHATTPTKMIEPPAQVALATPLPTAGVAKLTQSYNF